MKELAEAFLPGEMGLPFDDSHLPKVRIRKGKFDPKKARAKIDGGVQFKARTLARMKNTKYLSSILIEALQTS